MTDTNTAAAAEQETKLAIARLVRFGRERGMLGEGDEWTATNALLDLLQIAEPYTGELPAERDERATDLLEQLLDYAAQKGILPANTVGYRELFDARLMGILMPRQSEVAKDFWATAAQEGISRATDRFYQLSIDSNYIRMDRILKNQYWLTSTGYGELEITVNLSKPEKDPKDIAAERSLPQSHYPKCLLCVENVGYAGRLNHPARQNHRIIPLQLEGKPWFFQYSPYVYYNEHSIIFNGEHVPMTISRGSFVRLLEFVQQFGHYFIGSNADLPIVGGSILSHDHFQGGRHRFAMEKADVEETYTHPRYPGVRIGRVCWPMSVIRISGMEASSLIDLADEILGMWRGYSDPDVDILAFSEKDGVQTPHNTITPIARRNQEGELELDLVLRNNRTTEEHPMGLFHPHAHLHHIKKENIGLIEVMGLAVLPGRLKQEMEQIAAILTGAVQVKGSELHQQKEHPLHSHAAWIEKLVQRYGVSLKVDEAAKVLQEEVGLIFMQVLEDAGVYKRTDSGIRAFNRFMAELTRG